MTKKFLKVLVTGGPTRAYIDRVRYLSNYSTGELSFQICRSLLQKKCNVALVAGPCAQPFQKLKLSHLKNVETATQMADEVMHLCKVFKPDVAIFSAAVLDFEPKKISEGKVSSAKKEWVIRLKPTRKIIDEVGERFPAIARIGFKLEWEAMNRAEIRKYGQKKLKDQGLEGLLLNFLPQITKAKHPGYFFTHDGPEIKVESKLEISKAITSYILKDA